jgi:4-amino-4-deoxy-L-arabinose transferase-like glycosyltransferase
MIGFKSDRCPLALILMAAVALRLAILACGAVPFNSDEAVVALMARHTLEGRWPVFFYGQSYMGSLDATLIAAAFAVLGQTVLVIRLVQSAVYLATVATTYALGMRLFRDRWVAGAASMLLAVPTVLVSTYTTATLGGYGEILLLGNLTLWLVHAVTTDRQGSLSNWLGLGLVCGLGLWTSALSIVYTLPAGVMVIVHFLRVRRNRSSDLPWAAWAWAAAGFLAGSSPWLWHNFAHSWSALRFMITGQESSGIGVQQLPLSSRLAGMALLGLPALLGMRFPWSAGYTLLPLAIVPLTTSLAALTTALQVSWHRRRAEHLLLIGVPGTFAGLYLLSRFGTDPTGRYFLPLAVPLVLWTAAALNLLRTRHPRLAALLLACLVMYQLLGNIIATIQNPPGLTTQFDPSNRFDNADDHELISFLRSVGITRGYSNYFVAFRIAFLSDESVILSSQLPYKPDMSYNPADDRYPPYTAEVERAREVVYVTSIHPALDALLAERLAAAGLQFLERQIGPYHIFYRLSRHITPQELGVWSP